jgi:hypothetical protein
MIGSSELMRRKPVTVIICLVIYGSTALGGYVLGGRSGLYLTSILGGGLGVYLAKLLQTG